jgi:hypothetical protein
LPASPLSIFEDFKSNIYFLDIFLRNFTKYRKRWNGRDTFIIKT